MATELISKEIETKEFKFFGDFKVSQKDDDIEIKGYASTFGNIDRVGEIISPNAFDETIKEYMTNPILLTNHENNTKAVLGTVTKIEIDKKGLYIEAKLTKAEDVAPIIQKIKEGHIRAFSIGGIFEYQGNLISKVKLYEISVVAVPANQEALFTVKSFSDLESLITKGLEKNQALNLLESIKTNQVLNEDEKRKAEELLSNVLDKKVKGEIKMGKTVEELEKELAEKQAEIEAQKKLTQSPILTADGIKAMISETVGVSIKAFAEEFKSSIRKEKKFEFDAQTPYGKMAFPYKTKENLSITDKQLLDILLDKKALSTGGTGTGAEFVPTELASELINMMRIPETVPSLFLDIPMPSNPYKLPIEVGDPTWYLTAENTTDTGARYTASNAGTGNVQLDAKKLACRIVASEELTEDSVIPIIDFIKFKIAASAVEALTESILDGDTAGTHQDNDVTAANDRRKSFDGLRKLSLAIAALKVDLSTFTTSNLRSMVKALGTYGVDPVKLAWIVGVSGYHKMRDLAEVITKDKFGEQATIVKGKLTEFDGIPVIVSGKVRQDLNASGVRDGVTTTKTYLLLVCKERFLIGTKREITLKVKEDLDDSQYVSGSIRKAFKSVQTPSASITTLAVGYNILS